MKKSLILFFLLSLSAFGATNTIYNPQSYPLDGSKVQAAGQGVAATCAANTTTNLDIDLTDDMLVTGAEIVITGASIGDYIQLQVVQTANKSIVLATPLPGPWYVQQTGDTDFRFEFPVKATAGMTLRVIYHATVILITPTMAANFKLWKVLQ